MSKPIAPDHNLEGQTEMETKLLCRLIRAASTKARSTEATCSGRLVAIESFSSTWLSCPLRLLQSKAWLRHWIFEKVGLKNMLTIHSSRFSELYFCTGKIARISSAGQAMVAQAPKEHLPLGCFIILHYTALWLLYFLFAQGLVRGRAIQTLLSFKLNWPLWDLIFCRSTDQLPVTVLSTLPLLSSLSLQFSCIPAAPLFFWYLG